jgi:hypothetical protein
MDVSYSVCLEAAKAALQLPAFWRTHLMQTRLMSLVEAGANIAVGYLVAVLTQMLVFPLFGLHTTLGENLLIGGLFTIASLIRGYVLRRLFNILAMR